MSTTTRVITFGVFSGLIWSAIAAVLGDLFQSVGVAVTVFISGILTGILVSLALRSPLQAFGRWSSFVFGALSLPVGAFIFGVIISVVQLVASKITGTGYPVIEPTFSPFEIGAMYAFISVISLFALGLFPLAVLTTFILRAVIYKHENAA